MKTFPQMNEDDTYATGSQIKLVTTTVFINCLAQMTLYPIITPLSREVGRYCRLCVRAFAFPPPASTSKVRA